MIPITTYQSMCSGVIGEAQDDIISSRHVHSTMKQQHNDPIPLYFAWNRLDPNYKGERYGNSRKSSTSQRKEGRPPPQCRLEESGREVAPKVAPAATCTASSSSHHFLLVDPNLIDDDDNEPFVTEYADKYRAWAIPVKNTANAKKTSCQRQDERGVELALRGMGIHVSPTPPKRMRRTQQESTIAPSTDSIGSSRRQPHVAEPETMDPSLVSPAVDAPVLITCVDNGTAKTSEMDEQSYLTGTTAPSTTTGSANSFRFGEIIAKEDTGQVPTPAPALLAPSPTSQKNALSEKDGDIWIITSGKQQQQYKTTSKPRSNTGSKLRETKRDMAFWKGSSSSLGIPCPATPNHSVSKGRARRFGEKNKVGSRSMHIRSTCAAPQSCPSPQKLSKMLLTSRRGLSSTKLFPRLPNDPFRKNSLKRKV